MISNSIIRFYIILISVITMIYSDGFLGCLYNKNLCVRNIEWCFNDNAYGKCIHVYSDLNDEDMYKYEYHGNYLQQLNNDLESLFNMGFDWQDSFVQCHIQQYLNSVRFEEQFDDKICLEFLSDALHKSLDNDHRNNFNEMILDDEKNVNEDIVFLPALNRNFDLNTNKEIKNIETFNDENVASDDQDDKTIDFRSKAHESDIEFLMKNKMPSATFNYYENTSGFNKNDKDLEESSIKNKHIDNIIYTNNYRPLKKLLNEYRIHQNNEIKDFRGISYEKVPDFNQKNKLSLNSDHLPIYKSSGTINDNKNKTKIIYTEGGPIFLDSTNLRTDKVNVIDTNSTKKETKAFAGVLQVMPKSFGYTSNNGFIKFNDTLISWNQGYEILRKITTILKLNPNSFTHIRTHDKILQFRVTPSLIKMNATDFIEKIKSTKQDVKNIFGINIHSVGFEPQDEFLSHSAYIDDNKNDMFITLTIIGICSSIVISVAALFAIKKKIGGQRMFANNLFDSTDKHSPGQFQTDYEKTNDYNTSNINFNTNIWNDELTTVDIDTSIGNMILSYMENYLKNKEKLEKEWSNLQNFVVEKNSMRIAWLSENIKKNRYKKFVPFDHTRIVLNKLYNPSGNDYINASGIFDHDFRNPDYIAGQGPLADTLLDFWQMIWEKHVIVIVMLTKLTEDNKSMCCRYWPDDGSQIFHVFEVHLVSEHIWCDDYLVRSFYLKNRQTGETRTITQFHFISWSENSYPVSVKAFLEFRRKVNRIQHVRKYPILVHCNDGSGRTGTFILIDLVLNRIVKGAKEIDIAATLEHLREQRFGMVATKEQFQFVLMAITEEVHSILKTLPTNSKEIAQPSTSTAGVELEEQILNEKDK